MSDDGRALIVDAGIGNVGSVLNMIRHVGGSGVLSRDADEIGRARKLVLPGVGAFDPGMAALRESGLDTAITTAAESGAYVLGICLGLHLLLEGSEEGEARGLGIIPGRCRRFEVDGQGLRVPHMGWNAVTPAPGADLFGAPEEKHRFYFVHSYYPALANPEDVAATCVYGSEFHCAAQRGRVMGVQFHAEKSHRFGMALFERFLALPC